MRSILFVCVLAACSSPPAPKLDVKAAVCAAAAQSLELATYSAENAAREDGDDELHRCIALQKVDEGVRASAKVLRAFVDDLERQKVNTLPAANVTTEFGRYGTTIMEASGKVSCAHTQNENYPKDRAREVAKEVVAAIAASRAALATQCR